MKPIPLHFKTSSGIKSIVGKDLITDKFVAIFELVKNSYDARASEVKVIFKEDVIYIIDNGIGMSYSDLTDKWLNLAYSDKKEGRLDQHRVLVGSKGIGRMSSDCLGQHLIIKTKKYGGKVEHQLTINWNEFDQDLKILFEKVDVLYQENLAKPDDINRSYTKLKIHNLHHEWSENEIERAKENLRRLKNPFINDDGFQIVFKNKTGLFDIEEVIESNIAEILKDKSITIEATISEKIEVSLFDRGTRIYSLMKENLTILRNTNISISINYLTTSAKSTFTRRMKIEPVNYGNIFIYKNGFRVFPYGEKDYDLFELNTRKNQGYSRYLATREMLGFIDISDQDNFFKEPSSRNSGFIKNIYLETLQDLYMDTIHRPLEKYINLIKWGEIGEIDAREEVFFDDADKNEIEKFKKYIAKDQKDLRFFNGGFSVEENKPQKKLEKILESLPQEKKIEGNAIVKEFDKILDVKRQQEKTIESKNKIIQQLKKQNENLLVQRSEESYGQQISHHFTTLSHRLEDVVEELNDFSESLEDPLKIELYPVIRKVRRTALELDIFRDLLIKTNYETRSPQIIDWIKACDWFAKEKNITKSNCKIILIVDTKNPDIWKISNSYIIELIMFFENFYKNAREHNATKIEFEFNEQTLNISSDSDLIEEINLDRIFDLGFSTKPDGTGIGLNQIKGFLKKMNFTITVLNENNLVKFKIVK